MPVHAAAHDTLERGQEDGSTALDQPSVPRGGSRPRRVASPSTSLIASLTAGQPESEPRTAQLLLPLSAPLRHPFTLLQQWEGVVSTEPREGEFVAVVRDLTNPTYSEEQAMLSLEHVPPPDRKLVVPGAVFYWSIGYEDTPTGTRRTISVLRFRRLPAWTHGDMRRIAREVERFQRLFGVRRER